MFVEYWKDSDFANVSVEWWIFYMNVKWFFCSIMQGVAVSLYDCEIFNFWFKVISRDVVASDGTGGLLSMVWNSFFLGPVGFTFVFSCAVVGWAFPVVELMFTPFKLQDNWIFISPPSKKYIGKQFSHITKCHLLQKVFKLQILWSSSSVHQPRL